VEWIPTDRSYPELFAYAVVAAVAVTLVVSATITVGAFGAFTPTWEGTSELRGQAESAEADPIILEDTERYETEPAEGTIAFVLAPEEPYEGEDAERLVSFVEDGGTLLVADASGEHANPLLEEVGATSRVDGDPLRELRYYHESPALVSAFEIGTHPYLIGVDELTLNHGSALEQGEATPLVSSSEYSYLDRTGNEELSSDDAVGPFPVVTAEGVGDGQVVVVSDPSVFINAMLEREGNRAFASALIQSHDRVIFDTSHSGGAPPLAAAVYDLRESPLAQVALGGLLVFGIRFRHWLSYADRFRSRLARLKPTLGGSEPEEITEAELRSILSDRYPDWESDRRRRVVTAVISDREEKDGDE